MNTPAHAVVSLLALSRDRRGREAAAVYAGALLPDLPMLLFYGWEKLRRVPEAVIWGQHYFAPAWQAFFDAPNSLPLLAVGWLAARWRRHRLLELLVLSMGLHAVMDLFTHGDDAHRHLWPLVAWRFEGPVSYWDPSRYGWILFPLELLLVAGGSAWLFRRWQGATPERTLLAVNALVYLAYGSYALAVWT